MRINNFFYLTLVLIAMPVLAQSATVEVVDTYDPIVEESPSIPIDVLNGSTLGANRGGGASNSIDSSVGYWKFANLVRDWFDGNDWRQLVQETKSDNYSTRELKGVMTLQGSVQSKVEANIGVTGVASAGISFEGTTTITTTQEYVVPPMNQAILRLEAIMYTCVFNETYYIAGIPLSTQEGKAYMAKGNKFTYTTGPIPQ